VLFIIIMVPLLLGIAWKTGYLRTLFTTIETGNIKFVDAGETNVKTYINIPGKILQGGEIINGNPDAKKGLMRWIQKKFGFYWVGFAFLGRKVHTFSLIKERESRELKPNMEPSAWIEREQAKPSEELRWKFPRPVLVPDVKFQDNIEANILVLCKFEVLRPTVLMYIQKGSFFENLISFVRSGMVNYCKEMSADMFKSSNLLDGGDMSTKIRLAVNDRIEDEFGVRLTGLAVPIYNMSRLAEEEALEAAELARLNGLATIATAEANARAIVVKANADAEAKLIDAKAEAEADQIRAVASVADVVVTARTFKELGADPNIAVQQASGVGRATRFADPSSKVTTLVDGQSNVALPLPQKQVVLAER